MSVRLSLVALLALVTSVLGAQVPASGPQPASAATGLIVGRVVDGESGAPLIGVTVTLGDASGSATKTVVVDSKGRFMFRDVPAGRVTLQAGKNGYGGGSYGQARVDGPSQPLVLDPGERLTDVTLRKWRFGSISGSVIDDKGDPVVGAQVLVLLRTFTGGRPHLFNAGDSPGTDDRGMYRVGYLRPGEYFIAVSSRLDTYPISFAEESLAARDAGDAAMQSWSTELNINKATMGEADGRPTVSVGALRVRNTMPISIVGERLWTYPYTYYPAARTADTATAVTIRDGDERTGVDIRLALAPTVRVSGTVAGPSGPISHLGLRMMVPGSYYRGTENGIAETVTDDSGAFTFLGVTPGDYEISGEVSAVSPDVQNLSGSTPLTVGDKDIAEVSVVMRPSARVSGHIEIETSGDKPAPAQYRAMGILVRLEPAEGGTFTSALMLDAAGNFRSPVGLVPGKYFIRAANAAAAARVGGPGQRWTLKSAMAGGRDVSDVRLTVDSTDIGDITVTFTDRQSAFTGTVRTPQGTPDANAAVLVFPTDSTSWIDYGLAPRRLRNVRADLRGAFSIPNLPAGEYFVVALPDEALGEWQAPTFLQRASQVATRLRIADGASASIDLRTQPWQR